MPPVGFEPKIPAGERPQTYALDRAANEAGRDLNTLLILKLHNTTFSLHLCSDTYTKYWPVWFT